MALLSLLILFSIDGGLIGYSLFSSLLPVYDVFVLLFHGLLSVGEVYCLRILINKFYPDTPIEYFYFLFLFNIFIPILGMVFAITITSILLINHKKINKPALKNIDIKIDLEIERPSFGVGGAVARLGYHLPLKDRLEALLKISSNQKSTSNKYVQALNKP